MPTTPPNRDPERSSPPSPWIQRLRQKKGFTLIEILTAVAIIATLSVLLFPAVTKVREMANRAKSASNMRQIALAYALYTSSSSRTRHLSPSKLQRDTKLGTTPQGFAEFLAKTTGLTEASLWIIESDPALSAFEAQGVLPATIGYRDADNVFHLNPPWDTQIPIAYTIAIGHSPQAPASTTPLLWTRGLTPSGTWKKDSPWGGKGGHIAFLDGHVEFYHKLGPDEGQLLQEDGSATIDYRDLISKENLLDSSHSNRPKNGTPENFPFIPPYKL